MSAITNALDLLINIIIDAYIFILLLRLLLQKFGAHWYNPICQFVIRFTEPVLKPLRKIFPGVGGFDLAIVLLAFVLEGIELYLLVLLKYGMLANIGGAAILAAAELCIKLVNIFFYATIFGAIMSWFPALQNNPLAEVVHIITEPLLRIARRYVPIISGFDLSPLVVILILLLLNMLIFNPIVVFATGLLS